MGNACMSETTEMKRPTVSVESVPQRPFSGDSPKNARSEQARNGSGGETPAAIRRVVFISHANPEDNPAATWFATQLTLLGYEVWCDLKNTHGGESEFWLKVQKIIENEAAKFIYILSNASCDFERKRGIYKEVQTADNLRMNNFIIPVRIEKLTRSLPILLSTSIYIDGENWAAGLQVIAERLREDGVPRRSDPDFEKISSWWPGIAAERLLVQPEEEEIVSNILEIKALPRTIHFIKVLSGGHPLTGFDLLSKVLPENPAFYAHGDYAITFASPSDFGQLREDLDFVTAYVLEIDTFVTSGHEETGVLTEIACNIVTYLVGQAWDAFLAGKDLSAKKVGRNRRAIRYPRDGLIPNNRAGVIEPGKRKVSIQLIGSVKHYRKTYRWHFGVLPDVDLRVHHGIILTPKIVVTPRYNVAENEIPVPIDDKKVLRAISWWNQEWRQKMLAFLAWLSGGEPAIVVPVGCQQLVLSSEPQSHKASKSFREMSDDEVINQTMEALRERAHSS
jgi:hypothetical protein